MNNQPSTQFLWSDARTANTAIFRLYCLADARCTLAWKALTTIKCFCHQMTFAAAEKGEKGNVYGKEKSAKHRSKTFPGIARAMAEQWGVREEWRGEQFQTGLIM